MLETITRHIKCLKIQLAEFLATKILLVDRVRLFFTLKSLNVNIMV